MNVTPLYGESQANTARTLIGGQAIGENRNDLLRQVLVATANKVSGGGSGTVTSVSVTTQNGVSATVTNPTTTPALAFTLGAITPTTVRLSGSVSGTTLLQSPAIAGSAVITFPSVTGTLAITGNTVSQFAAGGTLSSLTGLSLRDTSAAFDATLGFTSSTALTQARALTFDLVNGSRTFKMAGNVDLGGAFTTTGSGTIALGGFTLTVPATGTAALRGTANTFSAVQTFSSGFSGPSGSQLLFGTAAVSSVLIRADKTWFPGDTFQLQFGDLQHYIQATYSSEDIWNGYYGVKFTNNSGTPFIAGKNSTLECVLASAGFLSWNSDLLLYRKAAATLQLGADAAGVTNQTFTAASRITSDGVGANLTIAPGNGRGGAGGTLILATFSTAGAGIAGTLTTRMTIDTAGAIAFPNVTAVVTESVVSDRTLAVSINGTSYKICLKV
jgi:hypothetical protein